MKNSSFPAVGQHILLAAVALAVMACDQQTLSLEGTAKPLTAGASAQARIQQAGVMPTSEAVMAVADVAVGKLSDAVIAMNIHGALLADPRLSSLQIGVDAHQGLVLLTGTAPDPVSRAHASVLASRVEGVVAVDNQIALASAASP
ncbi:MAG: BON domain-containing protein [Pseudomonadota bacterium]